MALWQEKRSNLMSVVVASYLLIGFISGLTGIAGTWIADGSTADRVNWGATFGHLFWMSVGWPITLMR